MASPSTSVYLDHAADTPVDDRVQLAVARAQAELVGSPHNLAHGDGRRARDAVEAARAEVAQALGAAHHQVIFTSGATESNNLALLGTEVRDGHIITCATEHASVLEPIAWLERHGARVTRVPVDRHGRLDPDRVLAAVTPATRLVSLMWVNNELGTIHPVAELGSQLRRRGVRFHVDAAQAFGRIPVHFAEAQIELLTVSARKAGGPPGIGALVAREPERLRPMLLGGGHQQGIRAGSLPTALCVGFGVGARLMTTELEQVTGWLTRCTQQLRSTLAARIGGLTFLTPDGATDSAPGILSAAFEGTAADDVLTLVGDELAIAAGSACTSGSGRPSHVLEALPLPPAVRRAALRLSPGRHTTAHDLDRAVEILADAVALLRRLAAGSTTSRRTATALPQPQGRP